MYGYIASNMIDNDCRGKQIISLHQTVIPNGAIMKQINKTGTSHM